MKYFPEKFVYLLLAKKNKRTLNELRINSKKVSIIVWTNSYNIELELTSGKNKVYRLDRQGNIIRGNVIAMDMTNPSLSRSDPNVDGRWLIISPVISVSQKLM